MTTPTPTKDRITCHVLDTTTGQPARGVRVKLELELIPPQPQQQATSSSSSSPLGSNSGGGHHQHGGDGGAAAKKVFESQTDDDGRVKAWLPYSSALSSGEVPVYTLEDVLTSDVGSAPASRWTLRFDTAAYWGGEDRTFFPEVVVSFTVMQGQHYHVPLLLAPYSYSTYRGS